VPQVTTNPPALQNLSTGLGYGIAGAGGLASGIAAGIGQTGTSNSQGTSNTTGTTTQQGTSVTNPNISPQLQALLNQIMQQAGGLQTPNLSGYQAQQTQQINQASNLQSQAVQNIMAARGLSTSPVAGTTQANIAAQRQSQLVNLQESLPLLLQQLQIQNLTAEEGAAKAIPYGTTTTSNAIANNQSQTNSNQQTQTQQGGGIAAGIAGGVGGIASILASLFSDKRLKDEIKEIPSKKAVERILALKPSTWKWKGSEIKDAGILAQDLEKVMPELVDHTETGIHKVNYAGLIGEMLSAIKGIAIQQQESV
jgi:Chaperone of endosialidase